ncbi:cytochrome P450 CYP749A22-like [Impatiens glandulifera]|uniref:cytochrome P450 CYP749A22-like n=1 Tax=Impatiens glandulifera TaxID=253017 RepID=UPI001FB18BE6|nr:cytochrome P450 CYP749A22-like [Impatiens glandulifera]
MMLDRWIEHEGKEIEVFEDFRLLTLEIISRTFFGSINRKGQDIFEMIVKLSSIASRNLFKVTIPWLSKIWKSKDEVESEKLEQGINDAIIRIVRKRVGKNLVIRMEGEIESFGNDLLGLLVKTHKDEDENSRISLQDVIDECKTFYIAGHETMTTMMGWIVFLLSLHQDWQDKAREEVFKLFGNQKPNAEGLTRMKTVINCP